MENQQESQFAQGEVLPEEKLPPASSFSERITNVFAGPGELYTELAIQPVQTTSWLIPMIMSLVVTFAFVWTLFGNPTLRDQMMERQTQEIQKKVEKGEMTQEQADQASAMMNGNGSMIKIIGSVSGVVVVGVAFFIIPLIIWGAMKLGLKYDGSFGKILEMFGLASLIGILGSIVTLMMMIGLNTMFATPSAALLVMGSYDRQNTLHNFLAVLNVFTLWETGIVGIGIAKLSKRSTSTGMGLAYGLWGVWAVFSALMGWGMK